MNCVYAEYTLYFLLLNISSLILGLNMEYGLITLAVGTGNVELIKGININPGLSKQIFNKFIGTVTAEWIKCFQCFVDQDIFPQVDCDSQWLKKITPNELKIWCKNGRYFNVYNVYKSIVSSKNPHFYHKDKVVPILIYYNLLKSINLHTGSRLFEILISTIPLDPLVDLAFRIDDAKTTSTILACLEHYIKEIPAIGNDTGSFMMIGSLGMIQPRTWESHIILSKYLDYKKIIPESAMERINGFSERQVLEILKRWPGDISKYYKPSMRNSTKRAFIQSGFIPPDLTISQVIMMSKGTVKSIVVLRQKYGNIVRLPTSLYKKLTQVIQLVYDIPTEICGLIFEYTVQ